jgi:tRNA (cytidine/uridine-2'-O-)-methyltransferase
LEAFGGKTLIHIVLVEPEIPANTGNIARTCAVTGAVLHLVEPLGYVVDDKRLKRAGLDYWHLLDVRMYPGLDAFMEAHGKEPLFMISTRGGMFYTETVYPEAAFFLFGKETRGLPEDLLEAYPETTVRIPMLPQARSLNLSNAVAVVVFEALRQRGFPRMV